MTFDGYLIDSGSFELRDTDGITRIAASLEGSRLNVHVQGAKPRPGLRLVPLPGVAQVDTVKVNGTALDKVDALPIGLDTAAAWTRGADGTVQVMIQPPVQRRG